MGEANDYNLRYLIGIVLFNRQDYFAAHEVWEELWHDCESRDRRFYQSLIQAAVALYHGSRNNATGAGRLYKSGRTYMAPYRPRYHGLEIDDFWSSMETALKPILSEVPEMMSMSALPQIRLDPDPDEWPSESAISQELADMGSGS